MRGEARRWAAATLLALTGALFAACGPWGVDDEEPALQGAATEPLGARLGGLTTSFRADPDAFGVVARGLTADELQDFAAGRPVFDRVWTEVTGLAPDAIANRCATCHPVHGRSVDPLGRVAPQLIGLGLLQAVPDATLARAADPDDRDGDGISGAVGDGRFGWGATQPTVADQVANALATDFGVDAAEIGEGELAVLVAYTERLAVPARRGADDPGAIAGAELFDDIGCAACHTPRLETGSDPVPALSQQVIWPYTDLLLHDLGEGDHRTPPLWGLGLLETVNGQLRLLHDGRATSFEEAIAAHGGEAAAVRDRWEDLSDAERDAVMTFLARL